MICVTVGLSGTGPGAAHFSGTTTPGWLVLPVEQVNGECPAGSFILLEQSEYLPSPFSLDVSAATQISAAVLLLWAIGYAFRMLIKAVKSFNLESENEVG